MQIKPLSEVKYSLKAYCVFT